MLTIDSSDTSKPISALPILYLAVRQLGIIDVRDVPNGARTQDMVLSNVQGGCGYDGGCVCAKTPALKSERC